MCPTGWFIPTAEGPDYMSETLGEVHIMGELKVDGVVTHHRGAPRRERAQGTPRWKPSSPAAASRTSAPGSYAAWAATRGFVVERRRRSPDHGARIGGMTIQNIASAGNVPTMIRPSASPARSADVGRPHRTDHGTAAEDASAGRDEHRDETKTGTDAARDTPTTSSASVTHEHREQPGDRPVADGTRGACRRAAGRAITPRRLASATRGRRPIAARAHASSDRADRPGPRSRAVLVDHRDREQQVEHDHEHRERREPVLGDDGPRGAKVRDAGSGRSRCMRSHAPVGASAGPRGSAHGAPRNRATTSVGRRGTAALLEHVARDLVAAARLAHVGAATRACSGRPTSA